MSDLQRSLRERGVEVIDVADETGDGPASFTVVDPDGNPVLVDQHVPRPGPGPIRTPRGVFRGWRQI